MKAFYKFSMAFLYLCICAYSLNCLWSFNKILGLIGFITFISYTLYKIDGLYDKNGNKIKRGWFDF